MSDVEFVDLLPIKFEFLLWKYAREIIIFLLPVNSSKQTCKVSSWFTLGIKNFPHLKWGDISQY